MRQRNHWKIWCRNCRRTCAMRSATLSSSCLQSKVAIQANPCSRIGAEDLMEDRFGTEMTVCLGTRRLGRCASYSEAIDAGRESRNPVRRWSTMSRGIGPVWLGQGTSWDAQNWTRPPRAPGQSPLFGGTGSSFWRPMVKKWTLLIISQIIKEDQDMYTA